MHTHTHLLATKAVVLLRELCLRVLPPALGARPQEVLGREELSGEQGVLLHSVPGPLLDALKVEEAVALLAAPYLGGGGWCVCMCMCTYLYSNALEDTVCMHSSSKYSC